MAKKSSKQRTTKIITGKHELSEKEIAAAGTELSDVLKKKDDIDKESKLKAAEYKNTISILADTEKKLRSKLDTGEEDRDYECEEIKDEENKLKIYKDIKTKRTIKSVPFTAADMQYTLDDMEEDLLKDPKGGKKAPAKKVAKDEPYKFQTGDWVKRPTGKAFQLTLEDMGELPKKLRLADADEIRAAGGKVPLAESKGGKGYSHSSLLGEKD